MIQGAVEKAKANPVITALLTALMFGSGGTAVGHFSNNGANERLAKIETKIVYMEKDMSEMKSDIKELLKRK